LNPRSDELLTKLVVVEKIDVKPPIITVLGGFVSIKKSDVEDTVTVYMCNDSKLPARSVPVKNNEWAPMGSVKLDVKIEFAQLPDGA
jgi:hypothetical protein